MIAAKAARYNRNLLKVFYFFFYAANAAVIPFLNLYLARVGLSGTRIGIVSSVFPLVLIFAAPFWGILGDVTRRHQRILYFSLLATVPFLIGIAFTEKMAPLIALMIGYALFYAPILPLIDNLSLQVLGADRDQSPTEKTLELSQTFLKREDLFVTYKKEVKNIERECYQRLAASDIRVAEFYITKQHDYDSAKKRISTIRDEWLEKAPEIGVEVARLEVTLAGRCTDFKAPEESIKLAQVVIPAQKKVDMAARF